MLLGMSPFTCPLFFAFEILLFPGPWLSKSLETSSCFGNNHPRTCRRELWESKITRARVSFVLYLSAKLLRTPTSLVDMSRGEEEN